MTSPHYTSAIETISETSKRLNVQVPSTTLESKVERRLVETQRTAELKGFRKGHVPLNVVKQHYEGSIRRDALSDVIDECFRDALREHDVYPVGQPKLTVSKTEPEIHFSVEFEIMPKVVAKGYTGLAVSREQKPVSDEDVNNIVQHFLENQAELVPVENRPAQKGDHVDFSYQGQVLDPSAKVDPSELQGNRLVEIGTGELIAGFEDALLGLSIGESKTFETQYPKGFGDLSEKPVKFEVTLRSIKLKRLPELDDDFAKASGFESLLDLKVKARKSIEAERESQSRRKLEQDLIQKLVDKNKFEVPGSLVEEEKELLTKEWSEMLKNQNASPELIAEAIKKEDGALRERAEHQVRAALLLGSIADSEKISVTPEDLDAELHNQAQSMRMNVADIKKHYDSNPRFRSNLAYRLRERKTIAFLVEKAKISDAS